MKDVFSYKSYKQFLKDFIKSSPTIGAVSQLAQDAGCNRSYFSQMLNSKTQLTPDHAANLATKLGFSLSEQEYFLLLVLYERAADPSARDYFGNKLDKMTDEHVLLSKRLKKGGESEELVSEQFRTTYYSNWIYSAVHLLTSIGAMKTTSAIAQRLNYSEEEVREVLYKLKEMGLVSGTEGTWSHSGREIHISKNSNHTTQKHLNWRLRAVERAQAKSSINYTSVFTVSRKDLPKLQKHLLNFIEEQRQVVSESGAEELLCFNCDYFIP